MLRVPEFACRSCGDCRQFLYDAAGGREEADDGTPFLRADYGADADPPCGRCPKLGPADPPQPLAGPDDLYAQPWFWEFRDAARGWRLLGRFPDLSPPAADMAAAVAEADADAAEDRLLQAVRAAVRERR